MYLLLLLFVYLELLKCICLQSFEIVEGLLSLERFDYCDGYLDQVDDDQGQQESEEREADVELHVEVLVPVGEENHSVGKGEDEDVCAELGDVGCSVLVWSQSAKHYDVELIAQNKCNYLEANVLCHGRYQAV